MLPSSSPSISNLLLIRMMTALSLYRNWIISFFVACFLVGATIAGYYYVRHTQRESYLCNASHDYETLVHGLKEESKTIPVDKATVFITKYQYTPYAALVQMHLATQALKNNQLEEAVKWLQEAAQQSHDAAISAIARCRGARILITLKEFKTALQWLDAINCEAYAALIEEIRGDIFHALDKKEDALKSYHRAHEIASELSASRPLLQIKINDLS